MTQGHGGPIDLSTSTAEAQEAALLALEKQLEVDGLQRAVPGTATMTPVQPTVSTIDTPSNHATAMQSTKLSLEDDLVDSDDEPPVVLLSNKKKLKAAARSSSKRVKKEKYDQVIDLTQIEDA